MVAAWLAKAERDLENARLLIRDQKRLLDIASYHCQQAAEKALKGFLTARDTVFPKTHALGELIDLCGGIQPTFEQLRSHAEILSPLAHEFRYPGDSSEPTPEEAAQALAMAEEVYRFCEEELKER